MARESQYDIEVTSERHLVDTEQEYKIRRVGGSIVIENSSGESAMLTPNQVVSLVGKYL